MKSVETIEQKNRRSEKKLLRVAIYCRVSTDHDEQDESLEAQKDGPAACKGVVLQHGDSAGDGGI